MIDLPVTDDWGAGAYVTASVIRPMDVAAAGRCRRGRWASPMPRSIRGDHAAEVGDRDRAPRSTPRGPLPVAVKVDGVKPGETAYVTLAAVDLGILNLTGFNTPDPSDHYFGQRKLGVGLRDVYGRLIDGMPGRWARCARAAMRRRELSLTPPPTEELVAYFAGPIEVGADGYARDRVRHARVQRHRCG